MGRLGDGSHRGQVRHARPERQWGCRRGTPGIEMSTTNLYTQWEEHWLSASVVNHGLVSDPTICQSGFHLPHHSLTLAESLIVLERDNDSE